MKREECLEVKVRDTGAGIAQDDVHKLFTRFGKLHRTAKMNHEGIGLGLTIVNQIVAQSGGSVKVESKGLGHGSTFSFTMKMKAIYKQHVNKSSSAVIDKAIVEQISESNFVMGK